MYQKYVQRLTYQGNRKKSFIQLKKKKEDNNNTNYEMDTRSGSNETENSVLVGIIQNACMWWLKAVMRCYH